MSRALSGRVRSRSPTSESGGTTEKGADGRPAAKRTRKAINCEPCRTSKLKCDRLVQTSNASMQFGSDYLAGIDRVRRAFYEVR